MKARIKITLKNGVLDPQGKAIEGAVKGLGISGVGDVRQGKYIEVDLKETDPAKARAIVEQMCKDLLANTVIENYSYEIGLTVWVMDITWRGLRARHERSDGANAHPLLGDQGRHLHPDPAGRRRIGRLFHT